MIWLPNRLYRAAIKGKYAVVEAQLVAVFHVACQRFYQLNTIRDTVVVFFGDIFKGIEGSSIIPHL